jgi:LuxR family quorum-sensing system transcriptional regulator CciR
MFDRVQAFVADIRELQSEEALASALGDVANDLGFRFFALTHHLDIRRSSGGIRLHNYPDGWAAWFDEHRLGPADPVHRASNLTSVGFAWSELEAMIPLTRRDLEILELARMQGIGEGFTVPAHVPGEAHGSCSFAAEPGRPLPREHLPLAQLVGTFAFEAARRMRRGAALAAPPRLTDRQRDCLVWAARGKSDWEIARILGVSHETVIQHLKQARERYGVAKRTVLAIHALFDGTIGFREVLRPDRG